MPESLNASGPDLIGYLAACHEADNRETSILDLFHKQIQHRHFATDNEVLVSGLQAGLAIPPEPGLTARKAAATYKREKSLIYGVFPVVGTVVGRDGGARKLCAPLVFYPAKLSEAEASGEPFANLTIEPDGRTVNFSVFAELLGERDGAPEVLEKILTRVPEPPFTDAALSELIQIFRDFFPEMHVDELYRYPKLLGERRVRKARGEPRLVCLPAAAMALVPNPRASRGILFELAETAAGAALSAPIHAIFGHHVARPDSNPAAPVTSTVPAVLSTAQRRTLLSSRQYPLTLIVGPPGTGKSYTVSAVAVDHVLRGESVLIACRTDRALDVIENKLEAILGGTTMLLRGGSRDYHRALKSYLKRTLSGQLGDEPLPAPSLLSKRLAKQMAAIREHEALLATRSELEHRWCGLATAADELSFLEHLRLRWLDWRVERAAPHWELHERLEEHQRARIEITASLLAATRRARIDALLKSHRRQLKGFLDAIRARTSSRQERLFGQIDLDVLLGTFPLWMSTFRDLHRLAPFERELFDLVIIDEATQSDMASPLPALYRAKRAVVTGDPQQLRHVSFLSRDRQRAIANEMNVGEEARAALDYREKSLLDLVDDALASQDQVAFLNEHFRSMPQIIDFSNREFYGGRLRVMTARPATLRVRAVEIRHVGGRRSSNGANIVEADALVAELLKRIESERHLDPTLSHSIGVLSPFRDQVEHLSKKILGRVDVDDIEKHDLAIGTAYSFQGDERDIMLLSLVVDPESHPTSLRYLGQPDVFNVSITRARDHQIVFTSLRAEQAPPGGLLARFLSQTSPTGDRPFASPAKNLRDAFLGDVMRRLAPLGYHLWPTYRIAGLTVDLVAEKAGCAFGIDLIGYPGELAPAIDLERYRMLRRAGLSVFGLPYSAWQRDVRACLQAIERHRSRHVPNVASSLSRS